MRQSTNTSTRASPASMRSNRSWRGKSAGRGRRSNWASATARRRFVREAQAAAAVSHDHVVAIHAVEEFHDPPFMVMQFIEGKTLQDRIDASGLLAVKEILRVGMQTAAGLAAAHAQGL